MEKSLFYESEVLIMNKQRKELKGFSSSFLKLIITLFVLLVTPINVYAVTADLEITYPSDYQSKIAKGRDFYVIGTIKNVQGGAIPSDAQLAVGITSIPSGSVVRMVTMPEKTTSNNIDVTYQYLNNTSGVPVSDIQASLMPDLAFDYNVPASIQMGNNRACFSDTYFTALISGGLIPNMTNLIDSDTGRPYEPLDLGNYEIIVVLVDGQGNPIGRAAKTISIGATANKVLSRFSPQAHFDKVEAEAQRKGYTIFLDPFAGYWSTSLCIPGVFPSDFLLEILNRWRYADSTEYDEGTAHFYIYNVRDTSATYNVEIGKILKDRDIDDTNVIQFYRYDIGEPSVSGLDGSLVDFKTGISDSLDLTRVDLPDVPKTPTNEISETELTNIPTDTNPTDGVTSSANKTLYVNGVVKPLKATVSDPVIYNQDNTYTIPYKITTVRIEANGQPIDRCAVNVNRTFINGSSSTSILEFKYNLDVLDQWIGRTILITVQGIDSDGMDVPSAVESFNLTVQ
jgi:hypothetical protein